MFNLIDRNNVLQYTPEQIAEKYDHNTLYGMIGYYTGLDIDSIANMRGDTDVDNMAGAEIADNLENAWYEWFNNGNMPDYTPADMAADIVIYTAWQICYR